MPVRRIRFHGRGGEGVKLASRIVSRAVFLAGSWVQDSPLYGAERRGAPVVAFVRAGDAPIRERGYIDAPDAVVVLDDSLLEAPEAAVLEGVEDGTLVLVNTSQAPEALRARVATGCRVLALDVASIARERLGDDPVSAPIAAFAVRAARLAAWEHVAAAVRAELSAIGSTPQRIERDLAASRDAFDRTPELGLAERLPPAAGARPADFVFPRLPARLALPAIDAGATSELRRTAGWRTHRPVIDLARCTRCSLCFVLCPESAIHLDAEGWPAVDYDHCKGCLVCESECAPRAIRAVREEAA
jgi:pyruvate ferredoxin oxidoreductase gamma subunit